MKQTKKNENFRPSPPPSCPTLTSIVSKLALLVPISWYWIDREFSLSVSMPELGVASPLLLFHSDSHVYRRRCRLPRQNLNWIEEKSFQSVGNRWNSSLIDLKMFFFYILHCYRVAVKRRVRWLCRANSMTMIICGLQHVAYLSHIIKRNWGEGGRAIFMFWCGTKKKDQFKQIYLETSDDKQSVGWRDRRRERERERERKREREGGPMVFVGDWHVIHVLSRPVMDLYRSGSIKVPCSVSRDPPSIPPPHDRYVTK